VAAPHLTTGQHQAIAELRRIAAAGRELDIVDEAAGLHGYHLIDVSVDCSNLRPMVDGVRMRPRERLTIAIPQRFPFAIPVVETPHTRWADVPHVQWGRRLCLYRSESTEWNPSDGMAGFVERLMSWLERAAARELDAPGEPLHPPVAYPSASAGVVIARADAPRADDGAPWLGIALLHQVTSERVDLTGWRGVGDAWPRTAQEARKAAGVDGAATVVLGLAVILPRPITFEYPRTAAAMLEALVPYGIDTTVLLALLGVVANINRDLLVADTALSGDQATHPLYMVVGTPTRGIVGSGDRVTHLAAWRLPPVAERIAHLAPNTYSDVPELARIGREVVDIGQEWLASAKTAWAQVYEARSEVVTARDAETSASWLRGKRVLILGAGALGGPIAEACVRGGAARVKVADSGLVHPGILVRQPYEDADIGKAKATVLVERLRRIRADAVVEAEVGDVLTVILADGADPPDVDLIVDATANRTVRTLIERLRGARRESWPAVATVLIGHDATRGIATISYPGSSGGGADILRRLSLTARADVTGALADIVDDFFPDPPRTDLFQPEPGCSDVTFVGSAADVSGLAGQLLTGVFHALMAESDEDGMLALVVRMPCEPTGAQTPATRWFRWPNDLVTKTADGRYEVRVAAGAVAEMRAEVRRGARVRGDRVETGGSLLGGFDDAVGVVWIDEATGPPPDSLLSESHFEHGTDGVTERIAARRDATARVTTFTGMWHSHPNGEASPSRTDEEGMRDLVLPVERAPSRALLLIVGGPAGRWRSWLTTGAAPDWYARVVERSDATSIRGTSRAAGGHQSDRASWPGGWRTPPAQRQRQRVAMWLRWLRRGRR
jgi:integrative and conjugative element protein (TIGR02256 family)